MKLTENTKVKIRVPKHLYEAIQAELDKKEMEEGDYGHDETVEENQDLKEIMTGAEFEANKIASIFKIDPFLGSVILVGGLFLGIISLPKAIQLARAGAAVTGDKAAKVLSNIKNMFLKTRSGKENKPEVDKLEPSAAGAEPVTEGAREGVYDDFAKWKASFPEGTEFAQENNYMMAKDEDGKELGKWNPIQKQGMHAEDPQYGNLEEVFDLETLMEAVKEVSKKKAEDKKKKEAEAKKKKEAEDKKKAEAKKKAAAAKKK